MSQKATSSPRSAFLSISSNTKAKGFNFQHHKIKTVPLLHNQTAGVKLARCGGHAGVADKDVFVLQCVERESDENIMVLIRQEWTVWRTRQYGELCSSLRF
ncbi:hypothetical protein V6N13_035375 [Hibiscus sabdariffa]|uniref:Uncharacterized protein n=1 Tax=Hibiscus sabdariffa TaxID=183260 RepID=A0ABR2SAD3_9ROSI